MNPRVKTVKPTDDYQLILEFTNGECGLYDGSSRFRGVSSMCSFRVVHLWQDRSLQHIDFNEKQVSLAFLLGGTKNHI